MVFVPTAKAPPKAGAKELSNNSLNLAYSGQHPCFGPNKFIQFCRQRGDEYGMSRKALPRKQAKVDAGHQCFSVVAQARAKILQRLISPRAIFKWKNLIEAVFRPLMARWILGLTRFSACLLRRLGLTQAKLEESTTCTPSCYGTNLTFAKLTCGLQRSHNLWKFQSPRIEWHHLDALVSSCPGRHRRGITLLHLTK